MQNVQDKVVLITGASSGIGEEIAKLLAANGAKVVLGARREERLKKLAKAIGSNAIYLKTDVSSQDDMNALAALAKEYRITITKTNPVSQSQVCAGGVDLREIDPSTMECVNVPGLYLTGEVLDVDGICGGYNLHWAWATGTLAGKAAANKIGKQRKNR